MKYPFIAQEKNIRNKWVFITDTRNSVTSYTDYELLFHYFKILQPKKILVAGGFSNCDLFYAVQSCNNPVDVVNYDNTTANITPKIDWLKEYFNFNGTYKFINEPIDYKKHSADDWDLIWDHNTGELMHEIQNFKNIPPIILSHFGHPLVCLQHIPIIDKHTPLKLLTKNICYFGINDEVTKQLTEINDTEFPNHYPGSQPSIGFQLTFNNKQTIHYVARDSGNWDKSLKETNK